MVQHAQNAGIPFDDVLFDTWFSSPSQLAVLKGIGADVIAMIKKNSTKYIWTDTRNRRGTKTECERNL